MNETHANYSKVQNQLFGFLSSGTVFIHYPYPVERPYDADYVLTAMFATKTAMFLELNESDLLIVWGDRSFRIEEASGHLYTRRSLLCRRSGEVHIFQDSVIVFERRFDTNTQNNILPTSPTPSPNKSVSVVVEAWLSQRPCTQILLEHADGRMLNLWSGVSLPLSLLQQRAYYLLLVLADLLFLLIGQVTADDSEDGHLCLDNFTKLVHVRLVNANSPLVTADSGKLLLAARYPDVSHRTPRPAGRKTGSEGSG